MKLKAAIKGERAIYTIEGHPGLYLHVRGNGVASWIVRYRIGGAMKERVLSNDAARANFERITTTKDELRLGIKSRGADVWAERQAEAVAKVAAERTAKLTLNTVINDWIGKERPKPLRPRTIKLYRWIFETYIVPEFGKRPITAIGKAELKTHFDKLRDRLMKSGGRDGKGTRGEMAGKAFTYLQAVFELAVDENYIERGPMRGLRRPVPKEPQQKTSRPLRPDELRRVWHGADVHLSQSFARMVKLALLLGRRRAEITGARKDEFHLSYLEQHWIVPPREGNKSTLPSLVPLPPLALQIIQSAFADSRHSAYLFPQSRGADDRPTAPDPLSHAWRELCNALGISDDVNLHDARGLLTDALETMGVPDNIVSHCLHHTSDMKGTTAKRVYSSNQFRDEKRRALRLWELKLRGIAGGRRQHVLRWSSGSKYSANRQS